MMSRQMRMVGVEKRGGSRSRSHVWGSRIDMTIEQVAQERLISAKEIRGDCRRKDVKEARWEVWRRLCRPGDSIISVARQWPCDHSSIIHALNVLEWREYDRRRRAA